MSSSLSLTLCACVVCVPDLKVQVRVCCLFDLPGVQASFLTFCLILLAKIVKT